MASNKPKTITVKDLKNLKVCMILQIRIIHFYVLITISYTLQNAEDAFVIKERIGAGTYGEVFTVSN